MKNTPKNSNPINKYQGDALNLESSTKNNDLSLNEKLNESEMRYRRLFETAKDGILILDFVTGRIVDANPFIVNIIDYPLEEIIGKYLWEIGLFSNKEESEQTFIELKRKSYVRFEDMPIKSRTGKVTQVEFVSNVYLVNNIKVIQCNIRDITERKQTERKQELTVKILSILNIQDDWKQLIKDILSEIKNYTRIEAVGIHLKDEDDYPFYESLGFSDYYIQLQKYLRRKDYKVGIIDNNKERSYLENMCSIVISGKTDSSLPYFTQGGSFYSNNSSELPADITEERRHFTIHNQSNEGSYESIAMVPLYSGREIIGLLQFNDKRSMMVSLEMIEFFEKIGNTIGIAFKRIHNEKKIIESEQDLKKQNAEFISLNNVYLSLNAELIESIDEIQKINDELVIAKAKAEESDNLKSAFLANISHEIRTPLNAILGFSRFLLQPELSNENLEHYVQIINASSQQLLSVISDIIDISKIETGQITIDSELVNINYLLKELFETYKETVALKRLSLVYSCERPEDLIQINTDGNRIKQVFCNLLNNAIKFTSIGEIEFGYKIKEEFIEFYVKDTGTGINPEHHALIFQRFRQEEVTNGRVYGGNGLGLSISKALVEKLGGTIEVNSELGIGSTFTFTIPYKNRIEDNVKSSLTNKVSRIFDWNNKTILIVEDEIFNHAYIEKLLSDKNVKLLHAWDGKEAVEHVKNHSDISLVLMDIKMPIMDGYEAVKLIKNIRPKLQVIAQTAYVLSHDKEQALRAGFDNYIAKPISQESLVELITRYLN